MTIETKFKPGDPCFYMKDNKVMPGHVQRMEIYVTQSTAGAVSVSILVRVETSLQLHEENVFPSKTELLASL